MLQESLGQEVVSQLFGVTQTLQGGGKARTIITAYSSHDNIASAVVITILLCLFNIILCM